VTVHSEGNLKKSVDKASLCFRPFCILNASDRCLPIRTFLQVSIGLTSFVRAGTDYGPEDRMIGVRIPAGAGNFFLRHRVETGSRTHPASYPLGTGGFVLGGKATET
jgi:hypothetical protein